MLRALTLTVLVASTSASSLRAGDDSHHLPKISQQFCAEMHDILTLSNGEGPPPNVSKMCYDKPNLMYTRNLPCSSQHKVDACTTYPKRTVNYLQRDNKMYIMTPNDDKDGFDCVFEPSVYEKDSLEIPFDFTYIDDGSPSGSGYATFVNSTTIDGVMANTWMHDRGGIHGTMYWFTSLPDKNGISDMIVTDDRNKMVNGNTTIYTSGARHYKKDYTRTIPDGQFDIPKGVKCVKAPKQAESLFDFEANVESI